VSDLVDYAGCTHIHTRYSDGSYNYDSILQDAKIAGLDFVLMADHDTLDPLKEDWQRWHDGVLCIVGTEISSREGHIVSANINDCDGYRRMPLEVSLQKVREQGGIAFAAHPMGKVKRVFNIVVGAWHAWNSNFFHGIELWCYMHDWIHDLKFGNFRKFVSNPDTAITGPEPELLALWDKATQKRTVSAVGALDNHARNLPFHSLMKPIWTVLPHEYVFRTVRTHVLVESLSMDAEGDVKTILNAMAKGSCYVSYDLIGNPQGFSFAGRQGGRNLLMGDEISATKEPVELSVESPVTCEIRLIRDGRQIACSNGCVLQTIVPAGEAGVFRVEAYLNDRPWIYSNPIYIRPKTAQM